MLELIFVVFGRRTELDRDDKEDFLWLNNRCEEEFFFIDCFEQYKGLFSLRIGKFIVVSKICDKCLFIIGF